MNINMYLAKYKIKRKDFAASLGMSTKSLYQVIGGSARPSRILAMFIDHITEGEVSFYELRGERKPRKTKE